ncbi:SDR family oxidoreductase [Marinoscillum furvescens]|uniref:NAD(P)H dehydrogenase (Quinone) n=1 Tax=Marinoscillum furvescens DSM 4134 TaxID=1122208 RepID=A0A3D9L3M0_MARFU|nr:SDR family oxidoreductase [Marinoscillum furvescens]RED97883.1 NAD(P)H dehydrogenase (quinone) [Marinoscillum furvescens DSM 4134]
MKIAITSASGKLGATIVKQLISKIGKESVVAIARTPQNAAHLGVEVRKGDYNSREQFDEALKGVSRLLLVSGMDAPDKRIGQHRNVIQAAKSNGVEKVVYTSIIGLEEGTAFSPIVQSNRQTEADVRASGMDWSIGRNGIYIEPDLEYLDTYLQAGEIHNCAGDGRCTYTSRAELAVAYAKMLLDDHTSGKTYRLAGQPITQSELAEAINSVYHTNLKYKELSVRAYKEDRIAELGEFMGTIIAGIYEGIRKGANDVPSDFETLVGRPHLSPAQLIRNFQQQNP